MKKTIIILSTFIFCFSSHAQTLQSFHDFEAITIMGDTISMSQYAGKKVMVVNVATFCGFTNQYSDLVALDSLYGGPNFAIVGFPCNDFGAQEPFKDSVILQFATNIYNVQFQLMHKISIAAADTLEVYKWLQLQSLNGVADAPVTWNFNKFCIDEFGNWVNHYTQYINPLDTAITNWITSVPTGAITLNKTTEVILLQNPTIELIQLRISNAATEKISVQLFTLNGMLIADVFSGLIAGDRLISYNSQKLNAGMYFLKIVGRNLNRTLKISVAQQ